MKNLLCLSLLVAATTSCNKGVTGETGAAACITAAACGIIPGGTSACTQFIEFVNDKTGAAAVHIEADQVNCIAAAGANCDAARACLAYGATPVACSGASTICQGNTWASCDTFAGSNGANAIRQFKCDHIGESCVQGNNSFECGFGSCSIISRGLFRSGRRRSSSVSKATHCGVPFAESNASNALES